MRKVTLLRAKTGFARRCLLNTGRLPDTIRKHRDLIELTYPSIGVLPVCTKSLLTLEKDTLLDGGMKKGPGNQKTSLPQVEDNPRTECKAWHVE